jgi:hypothetical protein
MAHLPQNNAKPVRDAVKNRVEAGREMGLHYDHPILLQYMIWHEATITVRSSWLQLAGHPMRGEEAGPITWRVGWTRRETSST